MTMAGQRMTTYILLRKNKEHGPFSLEELKTREVLPNDLIWMEGQSVCWMNPGEIKELKDLVGKVPEKTVAGLPAWPPLQTPADEEPVPEHPTGQVLQQEPVLKKYMPSPTGYEIPGEKDPEEPETRYAKPLDEIKAIYLKNLERQQKRKQFPITIPPALIKALPYAAFLFIGLLVGILINKKDGKNKIAGNTAKQETIPRPAVPETAGASEDQNGLPILPAADNAATVSTSQEPVYDEPPPEPVPAVAKKTTVKKIAPAEPGPDNTVSISKTDERAARNRETDAIPEAPPAKDLSSMVSVSTNDYQVGSFGGIRDLQLTLKNDSEYPLQQVTAELRYYKPGDELLKTENYHFYAVPARGMQVIAVPKSSRGVKVTCKLVRIEPKQ